MLRFWTENWLHPDFADWSLREILPAVHCPLLVIHGEQDEYGSAAHPRLMAEFSGGPVQLELLPGVHHVPHREQPGRVLMLVERFLAARP